MSDNEVSLEWATIRQIRDELSRRGIYYALCFALPNGVVVRCNPAMPPHQVMELLEASHDAVQRGIDND